MTKADDLHPVPSPPRPSRRPVLMLVGATALAVLGYVVAAIVVLGEQPPPPAVFAQPTPPRPSPAALQTPPVSLLPSPPTRPAKPASDLQGARATGSRTVSASPARRATSSPAPGPAFVVGRTVGVGVAGVTGYRLRNRDFVARIEADASAKGAAGQFTVRQGQAAARCLSFESVELPGYFLRHRNFVLLVEKSEPSDLFRNDATFCPVASAGGFALRSVNYSDHHLVQADGMVRLAASAPAQATAFRALPPI